MSEVIAGYFKDMRAEYGRRDAQSIDENLYFHHRERTANRVCGKSKRFLSPNPDNNAAVCNYDTPLFRISTPHMPHRAEQRTRADLSFHTFPPLAAAFRAATPDGISEKATSPSYTICISLPK